MQAFVRDQDLTRQREKTRRFQGLLAAICLLTVAGTICLCLLTRTENAARMLRIAWILTILGGWAGIAVFVCLLKPSRLRQQHLEGLLTREPVLREGIFHLTEEAFRIPGSVRVRQVVLTDGGEESRLNLDEELCSLAPPDGTRVRVTTVHRFITGVEILEKAPGADSPRPTPRKKLFRRFFPTLFPLWVLWAMVALLAVGFIINQITDTDPRHKIVIFADAELRDAPALAASLEKDLPEPIRMVKLHPFSYAMFNSETLRNADLYLVSSSRVSEYREWFAPLPEELKSLEDPLQPEGIRVYDPQTALSVHGDTVLYSASTQNPEIYWLFLGKNSPHLSEEDSSALRCAELFLAPLRDPHGENE